PGGRCPPRPGPACGVSAAASRSANDPAARSRPTTTRSSSGRSANRRIRGRRTPGRRRTRTSSIDRCSLRCRRMGRLTRVTGVLLLGVALAVGPHPGAAAAHDERETGQLAGTGSVPTYRTDGPRLLVCKSDRADFERRIADFDSALRERNQSLWEECQRSGYRHLQEAVSNVRLPGTNILVLPGVYLEEPSLAPPTGACASIDARWAGNGQYQVLSWEHQLACPNVQNLVAILGKKDLQIEGTGARPEDVVVDAQYHK